MKLECLAGAITVAAVTSLTGTAHAESDYPNKPITLIIGFAPGGPTDAIGRVLFKTVSQKLKVPIIIENKPGAGGNIGTQELIRAKPDGYTLLYGTSSITTAPPLFGRDDLNPTKAFSTVSCSVSVPLILLTNKAMDMKSAPQFYDAIKSNPGKYFQGSSGNGSIDHLVSMDIAKRMDLNFQHVPYKGNGPALTDLVSGNVNFMYSGSFNSAMPFIQNGQIKALAVTSDKRSVSLPDVPSLSEVVPALKGFDAGTWQVLIAPNGTDPQILKKLDGALQDSLKDPEVQKSLRFQGAELMNKDPEACQDYVASEYARWRDTIKRLGLKAGE